MVLDVIMSRIVGKKVEYVNTLDYKWMQLDMMSKVYSTIPVIHHHEEVKQQDKKLKV